jgi:hypothetical protein
MAQHKMVIWIAAAVMALAYSALSHGRVWYVDKDATAPPDGNGWPSAFRTLQDALSEEANEQLQAGDEIWVAEGTYFPDEVIYQENDRSATFTLVVSVGIYGGFSGVELTRDERDVWANETILSGDLLGNDGPDFQNYDDNSQHVVTFEGDPADPDSWETPVLDGFTVTGGNATPDGGPECGIEDRYTSWGGAVLLDAGTDGGPLLYGHLGPKFENCTFVGNRAFDVGGAVGGRNMGVHLRNCIFQDNEALSVCELFFVFPSDGGGAVGVTGEMEIVNCRFISNRSAGPGGAVENPTHQNEYVKLVNCDFRENEAGGVGGAVYLGAGSGDIVNCLFAGNVTSGLVDSAVEPPRGGGGIFSQIVPLFNCTFVDNEANAPMGSDALGGGAVLGPGGVTSCIFLGNSAENSSTSWLIQQVYGDCCPDYSSIEGFDVCAPGPPCQDCFPPDCSGVIDGTPTFVDPNGPDNNPATYHDNNYHLLTGSPCVDTGDPDTITNPDFPADEFDVDEDLNVNEETPDPDPHDRVLDGDHIPGAIADMGADELFCDAVVDFEPDGDVDKEDLAELLEEWNCQSNCDRDLDGDDDVDLDDINIFWCTVGWQGMCDIMDDIYGPGQCCNWDIMICAIQLCNKPRADDYVCWMLHNIRCNVAPPLCPYHLPCTVTIPNPYINCLEQPEPFDPCPCSP